MSVDVEGWAVNQLLRNFTQQTKKPELTALARNVSLLAA